MWHQFNASVDPWPKMGPELITIPLTQEDGGIYLYQGTVLLRNTFYTNKRGEHLCDL